MRKLGGKFVSKTPAKWHVKHKFLSEWKIQFMKVWIANIFRIIVLFHLYQFGGKSLKKYSNKTEFLPDNSLQFVLISQDLDQAILVLLKYAKIRVFFDPYFHVWGQHRRFCPYTGKHGLEIICDLPCSTQCYINQCLSINHQNLDIEIEVREIFLDISKTFDKVCHTEIFLKLRQNCIWGNLISILRRILNNWKEWVTWKGLYFSWTDIGFVVPQDSIHGSLLFPNIY